MNIRTHRAHRFAAVAIVFWGLQNHAWAWSTISLEPSANTFISTWEQDANGNANPLLIWSTGRIPLFRFDLSGVPSNATVLSAAFSATFANTPGNPGIPAQFVVYDLAQDFDETTASWVNWTTASGAQPWSKPGMAQFTDYDREPFQSNALLVSGPGAYSIDISPYVRLLRNRGRSNVNLAFAGADYVTDSNYSGKIYSRSDPTPQNRPHLTLTYSLTAPQAKVAGGDVFLTQDQWNHQPVTVDGSASARPDGSKSGLSYAWTLRSPTPGSGLSSGLALGSASVLSFTPDVAGAYGLELTVSDPSTQEKTTVPVKVTVGIMPHPRLQINSTQLSQIQSMKNANDSHWTNFYSWVEKAGPAWEQSGASPTIIPDAAYCDLDGCLPLSFVMDYLMTGSPTALQWATDWMNAVIYANGHDNSGGLTTLPGIYNGDQHNAGYRGGALIFSVASLYDWLFPQLSSTQKQDLIQWLNAAAEYEQFENLAYTSAFHRNDGAVITAAVASVAYATLGENPQAPAILGWFQDRWAQTLLALDDMGTGMGEGNEYSEAPTNYHLVQAANIAYSAAGQNLFLSHPFFKDRLLYNAFAAYPGMNGGSNSADTNTGWPGPYVETSPGYGDARGGTGWIQPSMRIDGMILCRMFPNTPECSAWSFLYRQPAIETSGVYSQTDIFSNILYYTPAPSGLPAPSALSYADMTSGRVYIRSDWGPHATWISIWAGPFFDAHQHLVTGAYEIFKDRHLLPDTGSYDNSGGHYGQEGQAYYQRTISSNGLLIGDPHEIYNNFISGIGCDATGAGSPIIPSDNGAPVCPPNDGGQRTMSPFGPQVDTSDIYRTYANIFKTGKLISFYDNGSAVTVVADITNAYSNPQYTGPGNSPKVKRVWRNWVYLRGADTLVVGDVVESTDGNFKKKSLLHAMDRIEVGGTVQTVSPGEEVHQNVNEARIVVDNADKGDQNQITWDLRKGNSYLLVHTAFPNAFQYRLVGGREPASSPHPQVYVAAGQSYAPDPVHLHTHIKDFWIQDFSEGVIPNHRSLNWMPQNPSEEGYATYWRPTFSGGFGRYRLEIEPTVPSKVDYFLNVEKPTLNANEKLPPITSVESPNSFGVSFTLSGQSYYVAFPKNTLASPTLGTAPIFIAIDAPSSETLLQGQVTINATASENVGTITQAALYDGSTLLQTLSGAGPFVFHWNASNTAPGQHTLFVKATDNAGNYASASVTLMAVGGTAGVTTNMEATNTRVYPNPWRSDKHSSKGITFDRLIAGSTIRIFSTSGHQVKGLLSSGESVTWNLANDSGDKIASGIYIYVVTDPKGNITKGKLAVVR